MMPVHNVRPVEPRPKPCLKGFGEPPSKKKVEIALREAGFDFAHNVLTQMAFVLTDHAE
jgi:hypothetical protein